MPTQVQFRRGTTAQNDNFTGASGEISIDTTKKTIRIHDGTTQGGFALVATSDLNTSNVTEGSNQYFTNSRARTAISASGSISYNNTTGVISFTQGNSDTVAEGTTNLYFSNARSRQAISASGDISYNPSTGVISYTASGDIESVTAGDGLTGGGSSGAVTLNVGSGYGITVNANNIEINNTQVAAALTNQSVTMAQATITGNLYVLGNTVEFNTETLTVEDKTILLANGSPSAAASDGAGILVDGSNASITYKHANVSWELNKSLFATGDIQATGNVVSPYFYSESDITLKEEISPIANALKKVMKLSGVDFKWKSNNQKGIGVIAQEVEKVFPQIVGKSSSGYKTVQYDSLIPLLIEAIKDQQKQIEELKKKIK